MARATIPIHHLGALVLAVWAGGAAAVCPAATVPARPPTVNPGSDPAAKPFKPGNQDITIPQAGKGRDCRLYVPASAVGKAKIPLVIVLHGGGGWGSQIEGMSRMDPVADANGFIVAYPNGTKGMLGYTWNGGDCCGVAMNKGTDDITFISSLIDRLVADYGVDPARVYATGISNGAIMSHRLACDLSDKIAAIAPIAGAIMVDCKPARPVPVIFFHGTMDKGMPPAGGMNKRAGSRGPFPPLSKSIQTWLKLDRCPSEGKQSYRKGEVTCTTYGPCGDSAEVEYCKIDGGGHTWPGGKPDFERALGHTTQDISASAAMWEFFSRHSIK